MAAIMVNDEPQGVKVYDPSAGSGTLLMNIAHAIGEDKCSIYSEDISQKSSNMLRLNLVLNNLSHSIPHIIKGNTILEPYYREEKFDYIVSNPPFKLDFSDFRDDLDKDINKTRFFAGIPKTPNKDVDKMAIYLLFIQHIMYSLSAKGKAAIVVPTGFLTAQSGIEKKIREQMIERGWIRGAVSMPSNIFASTGTNVSVVFLDKCADMAQIVLVDASKMGREVKDGKNQRTVLTETEELEIVSALNDKKPKDGFSVVLSSSDIKSKNYSFSAGQYFEIRIEHIDISLSEFKHRMNLHQSNLSTMFATGRNLETTIVGHLSELSYE